MVCMSGSVIIIVMSEQRLLLDVLFPFRNCTMVAIVKDFLQLSCGELG